MRGGRDSQARARRNQHMREDELGARVSSTQHTQCQSTIEIMKKFPFFCPNTLLNANISGPETSCELSDVHSACCAPHTIFCVAISGTVPTGRLLEDTLKEVSRISGSLSEGTRVRSLLSAFSGALGISAPKQNSWQTLFWPVPARWA